MKELTFRVRPLLGSSMVESDNRRINSPTGEFQVRGSGRRVKTSETPAGCWVYVLLNPQGKIYIGQTTNLATRLSQHNDPEYRRTLHTKRHPGPCRLIHKERVPTRKEAMRRERELKSERGRGWIRQFVAVRVAAD